MELNKAYIPSRFYAVAAVLLLMITGIVIKLTNIQFVEGEYYRGLAAQKTIKTHMIPANRGNVYSSDNSLLATSIPKYNIRFDAVAPSKEDFDANLSALSDSLAKILNKNNEEVKTLLVKSRNNNSRYVLLAKKLSYADYVRVKKFPLFNKGAYKGGFIVEQETVREYPVGLIAQRTVGYDKIDPDGIRIGKGIEWSFKDYLTGRDGKQLMQKMAKGQWKPIRDDNILEPKDGFDIYTTIDLHIQDVAHYALLEQLKKYEADHGCAVVMETKTGHIKAISNLGRNSLGQYVERLNYAIQETFEPGSTFKLLSLMALLEDKHVDTTTVFNSNGGQIKIYNEFVRDSKIGGYGSISMARAMEVSSNTVVVQAVNKHYKSNPKQFLNHVYRAGFHKPLDIQLKGAAEPYIPSPEDKKNWSGLSLPWMSWGYGISLTPLHTLTFYNAIANDGVMVNPIFVSEIKDMNKTIHKFDTEVINPKLCSQETIQKIKPILENVVKRGTASKLYSSKFSMAGKTGTTKNDYQIDDKHFVSSFVGYFPADDPKYSCIVVIHKPNEKYGVYGGDVSGPVFKKIAQKVYVNSPNNSKIKIESVPKKLEKQYKNYYTLLNQEKVPNLVGLDVMDAVAILENKGIKVKINGVGKVKKQSIPSGNEFVSYTTMYLEAQ